MNRAVMAAVVLTGLGAGWLGRAALEPSRPEAMLALFRDYCLGPDRHIVPRGLAPLRLEDGSETWADAKTRLMLTRSGRRCAISDRLEVMTLAEVQDVERQLRTEISARFPSFRADESNELGWPVFVFWNDGTPPGERRWGITLFHTAGPDAVTDVSITYPPSQAV